MDNRELVPFFSELLSTFRLFVSNWGSSQKLEEKVYLERRSLAVVVEEKQRLGMWVVPTGYPTTCCVYLRELG